MPYLYLLTVLVLTGIILFLIFVKPREDYNRGFDDAMSGKRRTILRGSRTYSQGYSDGLKHKEIDALKRYG